MKRRIRKNEAPDLFRLHLGELGLEFIAEHKFFPDREWRLDFFLPEHGIGIEIEGGISKHEKFHPEWAKQRHQRADGMLRDMEKYNHATMWGVRLLRFSTHQVLNGDAKKFLRDWKIGVALS